MPLALEIVTPEERVVTVTCDEVRLTSVEGQFGIRPGHTPLVAALAAGELLYVAGGTTHRYAAGEGFAEVSNDRVRVLVEEAKDRKSTRLNSSHLGISYAVFCLKKKKKTKKNSNTKRQ